MDFILIRHAATPGNLERRFIGVTDESIHESGRETALSVSAQLPLVEHIYLSPLLRCHQTAEILWPELKTTVIDDLRETDFGPFEGKTHNELLGDRLYNAWISSHDPSAASIVENVTDCGLRAARALEQVIRDAKRRGVHHIGVVSHGGTIMAMMARYGRPERDYYSWNMPNCAGYMVSVEENPLMLRVKEKLGAWQKISDSNI